MTIQRYDVADANGDEWKSDDGYFVIYTDHLAAIESLERSVSYYRDIAEGLQFDLQNRADESVVCVQLRDRIAELEARLEVHDSGFDGIYCRDETIRLQDERIKELEAELSRIRGLATDYAKENIRDADLVREHINELKVDIAQFDAMLVKVRENALEEAATKADDCLTGLRAVVQYIPDVGAAVRALKSTKEST